MKKSILSLILAPTAAFAIERPLHWTSDISRVADMRFDALHGDALDFKVDFNAHEKPVDLAGLDATLYWQTNGMGSAWWSAPGAISNSTARALFPSSSDPGDKTLNFYLALSDGSNVVYGASARVTFKNSPGFTPNRIEPPVVTLDFSGIEVFNAPWTEEIEAVARGVASNETEIATARGQITTFIDALDGKADSDDLLDYMPLVGDSTISGDITINGEVSINGTGGLGVEGGLSVYGGSAALYGGIAIGPAGDQSIDGNQAGDKIIFEGHGEDGPNRSELQPDGSDVMTSNRVAAAVSTLSDSIPTTTSNIVTKSYVEGLGISADFSTSNTELVNTIKATAPAPGDYSTVSNKAVSAVQPGDLGDLAYLDSIDGMETDPTIKSWAKAATKPTYTASEVGALPSSTTHLSGDVPTSRTINGKALSGNISLGAADVGAASAAAVSALDDQMTAVAAHLNAEDARFVSTNYNSEAHLPEASVEVNISNDWLVVWREMTRWDKFTGAGFDWSAWCGLECFRTNISAELDQKADRAWGFYDSHTGLWAPEGYTQISSSNILVAAGMGYQRTVTAGGTSYWVLTANEPYTVSGISSNGFFRVEDADGNVQFEIVKGDKRSVPAPPGGVTVGGGSPHPLIITYPVESQPTIEVALSLGNPSWHAETDASCPAVVTWTGSSGAYVATVTPAAPTTQLFVRATYQVGGATYISNRAPVSLSGGIIYNGTTYKPTVNGNKLEFVAQ